MRITFSILGVSAHHWLHLSLEDTQTLVEVVKLKPYQIDEYTGHIWQAYFHRVLSEIEKQLAAQSLSTYVRIPSKGRMVMINRSGGNVVQIEYGPQVDDPGLDEPSLRKLLARFHILLTAGLDGDQPLFWGQNIHD